MSELNRDVSREWRFLDQASYGTRSGFAKAAAARLVQGEQSFGDRWKTLTLEQFARELEEEAADLGAWAVLAVQALDGLDLEDVHIARLDGLLTQVARAGAQALSAVNAIRAVLDDATAAAA